jgi:uncharacterized protein YbaR (Trm112 family)
MYILLTDILSCPRCGPDSGLILLADRIEERRVLAGTLGCARCRGRYPVRAGVADLRAAPDAAAESETTADARPEHGRETGERALRWAALMGVAEGPGFVFVTGEAAALAAEIASMIDAIEVVAAGRGPEVERPGVSRIEVSNRLPFYSGKIRGVALAGAAADVLLEEGARVLGPLGRLVLEPAPERAEERLSRAGLRVIARQDRTLVAGRIP